MNNRLYDDQSGASLAEYALVLALVVLAGFAAIGNTGQVVRGKLGVDFAEAVHGTTSQPVVVLKNAPDKGATVASGQGSEAGDEDRTGKTGETFTHVDPHGAGQGNDKDKGNK